MLSQAIGVSERHLSNVVRGRRGLDPAFAGDLAQALGLEGPRWRYFVKLVELESTASPGARLSLRRELEALREELADLRALGLAVERQGRHWATAEVADAEQPDGQEPAQVVLQQAILVTPWPEPS